MMAQTFDEADAVTFSDIVAKLWHNRGLLLLLPLITAAMACIYLIATDLRGNRPVVYFVDLNGIANERYPGGAAFSPQDLLAPEVLSELRRRFNIDPKVDLREALTVTYGTPVAAGLMQMYRNRLAARNLTHSELSTLNEEYRREIQSATQSTLHIDVNYVMLGGDESVGLALAKALPEIWTQVYSTRFRILSDPRLSVAAVSETDENMKTVASVLVVDAALAVMRQGLTILSEDSRLSSLRTEDGVSVADLAQNEKLFRTIYFDATKAAAFRANDSISASYIANLRHKVAELQRNVAQYDDTLEKLLRSRQDLVRKDAEGQPAPQARDAIQLGESGLAQIVTLAERASSNQFIEQTLQRRQELAFEASSIQRELEMIAGTGDFPHSHEANEKASEILKMITKQYNDLLRRAEARLRIQAGTLYTAKIGPTVQGALFPQRSFLVLGAAGAVGGLLGMLFALLRPNVQARSPEAIPS